jgi:hypothetical protein
MTTFNIVELGSASTETRGVMFFGIVDPGGFHYYF